MEPAKNMLASRDPHEDFLRLFTHHEPGLRAFVHACLPRAADVDEVMQEISLVAWRKFSTLTEAAQFPRWACLIARYEILTFRRAHARDRLVLDEDIMEKLAEEGAEEMPVRHAQLAALDDCVAKLPRDRGELVLAAYAPEHSIKSLAGRMGRTEASLYQLLARIRQELLRCVERTLAQEAQTP
ncbi:RNA polymerase, sigma-24 subunit, ECF subfamily [Chthoniobacter flavus Ellin428]|uniref:RNA polymerase, sigma-24 subunit, ECF subfamily n=1 Tax=Chthoniobacter flavus Ellin428 TaxID=497964 RepID=B4D684_9BACT|nr:sigma-70 family RNA polymerase sigma factor [Chthoniobacter flavus]EDY17993.1 RNA polymerase, sigma-24 subunit, ECF subfamily [Chthoniobacter flavus Ellin428]TCO88235.1 RNA polymerase sigma-70 factor (ECF subfamily) [Chthoniobacter flavus]